MPTAKTKLLIVDDDVSLRTSLAQIFSKLGYSVQSAADGRTALSEIRRERPDILLSDLCMPGMSGFELLSEAHRRFPGICLIAMSGSFSGSVIPPGVTAAAFYEKGSSLLCLLRIVGAMNDPSACLPRVLP